MKKLIDIDFHRQYKNKAEQIFAEKARLDGWRVTKQGYPDFICYKGRDIMLVEVKQTKYHRLKRGQRKFMNTAARHGLRCYKWSPDNDWLLCREKRTKEIDKSYLATSVEID